MLTPLDQIATQNHLQILKAAIPHLPLSSQPSACILIKFMELQNIMHFYRRNHAAVNSCSVPDDSAGLLDILSDIRNYCEGADQEMIDQWIQLAGAMELYSIFSSERGMS